MEPMKSKKTLYWALAGIIVVILAFMALNNDDSVQNPDSAAIVTGTSTDATASSSSDQAASAPRKTAGNKVPAVPAGTPSDSTLAAIMGNSKVRVPQTGIDVALRGGQASYSSGAISGTIAIGSILTKVPTDNGLDVFVSLSVTPTAVPGKTGIENYVALFHVKGDTAAYTSAILVGTGLPIKGVEAKRDPAVTTPGTVPAYMNSATGYLLVVSYLDRKNAEPVTIAPSLARDFTAHVKNHVLSK